MPPVSLRDIARLSGVSEMTVSRVLRNQPRVAAATRETVLRHARELGYRPDPKLREFITYLRAARTRRVTEVLAWVWPDATSEEVLDPRESTSKYLLRYVEGAKRHAEELGYKVEEFFLSEPQMDARRLERILVARGIRGIIVGPLIRQPRTKLLLDWSRFSVVTMTTKMNLPAFDVVQADPYRSVELVLTELAREGWRRIALGLLAEADEVLNQRWRASFLVNHPLGVHEAERLTVTCHKEDGAGMLAWWRKRRPEILVHQARFPVPWHTSLVKAGFEREVRQTILNLAPQFRTEGWAGVEQDSEASAATAVDLLAGRLLHDERGLPRYPKSVLTPVSWVPGKYAEISETLKC